MEEQSGFHPIACESCRDKKSKCDREIPVCSQCTARSTACRYPPINKRGIPSGYLSFVEQRLLETEIVVFELLSTMQQLHAPLESHRSLDEECEAIADFSAKQSKSAKIEEWKNMPLISKEQRQRWWQSKKDLIHTRAQSIQREPQVSPALQKSAWEVVQEVSPALAHFEESSIRAVSTTPDLSMEQTMESLQTYDPAPIWQPPAPDPDWPEYVHAEGSSQEEGRMEGSFGGLLRPVDSEISVLSPDRSEGRPRLPEPGSLSEPQWRKYF